MKFNKYGNVKKIIGGIKFDSTKEANRYCELKLLQKAGVIKQLEIQTVFVLQEPFFDFSGKKQRDIRYIADFTYFQGDKYIVEDVKSPITRKNPVYAIKKKMLLKRYQRIFFIET